MNIYRSVRAVAGASGDGAIDWDAVIEAATASTGKGDIDLTADQRAGYADDVRDARDRVGEVAGFDFSLPETIEVQHRHHWIDANVATFRRVMAPLERTAEAAGSMMGPARVVNTGTMSVALAYLARNVLGQYDPLLLADGDDHALYFVHPNIEAVAGQLGVATPRFRRWIAFHEVTHAAEFAAAPWLPGYMEDRITDAMDAMSGGGVSGFDISEFAELNAAMTAVEGYAELLMDEAFDDEYADLRRKLDERRGGGGPVAKLLRRALGLGVKRQQYERGADFFEAVAAERGIEATAAVWDDPTTLPTTDEIDDPSAWIARVLE
ncbi:hypothetical protein BRD17_07000 [Halobacteriales archaeon SW_7_68_16]|nr:MAG: hypothetical protein BRD17_07000 [Halobacteriales archaeon SW_7_68_16]